MYLLDQMIPATMSGLAPICLRRARPARAAALLVLISGQQMLFANAGLRGEVYLMLMPA